MLKVFICSCIALSIAVSAFLTALNEENVNVVQIADPVITTGLASTNDENFSSNLLNQINDQVVIKNPNSTKSKVENSAPNIYLVSSDAGMRSRFENWKKAALDKDYLKTNLKNIKNDGKHLTSIIINHDNKTIKYYWSISIESMRKANPLTKFKFISGVAWRFTNSIVYFDSNFLIHLRESLHTDFYISKAKEAVENDKNVTISYEDVYFNSPQKTVTKDPMAIKAQTWLNFKGCHYIVKEDGSCWAFGTRHRTRLDSGSSNMEEVSLLKINNKRIPIYPQYASYQTKEVADNWRMQQKLTVLFQAGDEDNAEKYADLEEIFNFFEADIHLSFGSKVKKNGN
ncbi:MAG: hypothetical protein V3V74_07510 [Nitrosomonadaceae bacterium]